MAAARTTSRPCARGARALPSVAKEPVTAAALDRLAAFRAGSDRQLAKARAEGVQRLRIELVLLCKHAGGERLGRLARADADWRLGEDRPVVEPFGDEVDRAARLRL